MANVRCADCGLLAYHDKMTGQLTEVDINHRPSRNGPRIDDGEYEEAPLCLALAAQLSLESKFVDGISGALGKQRDCPKFAQWNPGFSPKEHKQMLLEADLKKLEESRRENDRAWQESQREKDIARAEQQRREDLKWKASQEETAKRRFFWEFVVLGIGATSLLSISTIIAGCIQASATRDAANRQSPAGNTDKMPLIDHAP